MQTQFRLHGIMTVAQQDQKVILKKRKVHFEIEFENGCCQLSIRVNWQLTAPIIQMENEIPNFFRTAYRYPWRGSNFLKKSNLQKMQFFRKWLTWREKNSKSDMALFAKIDFLGFWTSFSPSRPSGKIVQSWTILFLLSLKFEPLQYVYHL